MKECVFKYEHLAHGKILKYNCRLWWDVLLYFNLIFIIWAASFGDLRSIQTSRIFKNIPKYGSHGQIKALS